MLSCFNRNRIAKVLGILALILAVTIPGFASEGGGGEKTGVEQQSKAVTLANGAQFDHSSQFVPPLLALRTELLLGRKSALLQQQESGKDQWKAELTKAQGDRTTGITFFVIGLAGGAAATVAAAGTGSVPLYLIGSLGGAALTIYGVVVWVQAADQVDKLETEGRIKGYMSMLQERQGPQLSFSIPF